MTPNEVWVRDDTGEVLTGKTRHSIMMLIKVMYRLDIIQEKEALDIAAKYQVLYV